MLKLLAIRVEVEKYSGCLKYFQCTSQKCRHGALQDPRVVRTESP